MTNELPAEIEMTITELSGKAGLTGRPHFPSVANYLKMAVSGAQQSAVLDIAYDAALDAVRDYRACIQQLPTRSLMTESKAARDRAITAVATLGRAIQAAPASDEARILRSR